MERMDGERWEILLKLQAGADALTNAWREVDEQTARLRIAAEMIAAPSAEVITCSDRPSATIADGTPSWALANSPLAAG